MLLVVKYVFFLKLLNGWVHPFQNKNQIKTCLFLSANVHFKSSKNNYLF